MHVPFSFFVLPSPLFSPPCYYLRESGVGGASRVWGSLQPLPSWLVGGGGRGGRGGGGEARGLTEVEAAGIEVRRHKFPIGFTAREKIRKMLDYHFPFVCKKILFFKDDVVYCHVGSCGFAVRIYTYVHASPSLSLSAPHAPHYVLARRQGREEKALFSRLCTAPNQRTDAKKDYVYNKNGRCVRLSNLLLFDGKK